MGKTLCESGKKKRKKKDTDPKYMCRECGGMVKKKDQVCKPAKVKN